MKTIFKILFLFLAFLTSCSVPKSTVMGLPDQGYLVFVSDGQYADKTVHVTLDKDKASFNANVVRQKDFDIKAPTYQIASGQWTLKVMYDNKVIYNQKIFLSPQQTKKVILP
ncbi:MAG: hypothetical protein RR303_06435 [Bacteroidales bacterium]